MSAAAGGRTFVPNWVVRDDALRAPDKLVYIALLSWMDDHAEAWPSLATLAHDAGVSKPTVSKALRHLEEIGLVERQRRYDDDGAMLSNLYRMNVTAMGTGPR